MTDTKFKPIRAKSFDFGIHNNPLRPLGWPNLPPRVGHRAVLPADQLMRNWPPQTGHNSGQALFGAESCPP
ncbi:hypothetical protein H663_011160 [Limnohabitans planktonicus II-D5]|uniref:Uncharacterized protein n=1 Tax=Limnohabitans planktonicus II-D5 TaxID=1293045 RepID=A0A2T7UD53_9BURK|nr:hypothetical protein H663_011160 [Limnohabitans planktonicus II-D5]